MSTPSIIEALAALDEARGWRKRAPTREQFAGHALAHPFVIARPFVRHSMRGSFGLWALRIDGGVNVLEIGLAEGGERGQAFYSILGGHAEHPAPETIEDADGWLALDATGRPVVRVDGALRPDEVLPDVETRPDGGPFPWNYRMRVRVALHPPSARWKPLTSASRIQTVRLRPRG